MCRLKHKLHVAATSAFIAGAAWALASHIACSIQGSLVRPLIRRKIRLAAVRGDTVWRKIGSKPPLSSITLFMNADVSAVLYPHPTHNQHTHTFCCYFSWTENWTRKNGRKRKDDQSFVRYQFCLLPG